MLSFQKYISIVKSKKSDILLKSIKYKQIGSDKHKLSYVTIKKIVVFSNHGDLQVHLCQASNPSPLRLGLYLH